MIRTAVLLATLTAILLAVGFFFAGIFGMTVGLLFAFAINLVSYWYSDRIVLRIYRAKETKDKDLNEMVESLAREGGIPKPRVYIVPSDVPNAFATGRNPKHAAVAITEGLNSLSRDEMEGVIAHEISHIKNNDILVQTIAATIAGAISYIAQIGYWSLFMNDGEESNGVLGLVLVIIFAPIAAMLVKMAISRRREYKADFTGATLSKKPAALASALRKISETSRKKPMHASNATSHLWIVNPFKQDWFSNLFSTHPPVNRRIAKLERLAAKGIRDENDR